MPYREMTGDLFKSGLLAIGHGCNCLGVMGAGVAREFRRRYPDMYGHYWRMCANGMFNVGDIFVWTRNGFPFVYNLATQPMPGPTASIEAIEVAVAKALADADTRGLPHLGVPRIGAGLGGLPWSDVQSALMAVGGASPVELVVVTLP